MIDFKTISATTDRYNFHSHTQFCDGRAPMADFAKAAADNGFAHYGFSPHSPIPIESPCNMNKTDVGLYLDEFARLKSLYAGRINLYLAMEIDYLGEDWGPANPYFKALPLDYSIGSVHFIPSQRGVYVDVDGHFDNFKGKMERFFDNDIRYVVNTFYDQSLAMVAEGGFDIIGHLDKIGHNASHFQPGIEDEEWYKSRVNELIDAVIASGAAVEINTKALADHHRFFPAPRYWKRLMDAGVTILINSDAHYPHLIDASRREALDLLQKISAESK